MIIRYGREGLPERTISIRISVWPVVTAVMVVLAVAVCLAMAGDIRFAVIGVL